MDGDGRDELVERVRQVYHLCRRMMRDEGEAGEACYLAFERVARGPSPGAEGAGAMGVLRAAAAALLDRLPAAPEVSFPLLDETLRTEATRPGETESLGPPERERLLWELKQGCLNAVLHCLAPGERIAFVASAVLGLSGEQAQLAVGVGAGAFKVRLSRARRKIDAHLAPRCAHVDPRNPCRCPSRLGVALRRGFVVPPGPRQVSLRSLPVFSDQGRERDASALYRTLPPPEPPASLLQRIEALCPSRAGGASASG